MARENSVIWAAVAGLVVVVLILLEGRRQTKKYGPPSGSVSGIGSAMLELQKVLEPDKKTEILLAVEEESETAEAGEPPTPQP